MTATFTEWTDADSRALDAWARTFHRTPLQYDPKLAELLNPPPEPDPEPEPELCIHCERPFRRKGVLLKDRPETVTKATVDTCQGCYKAIREGRTPGQRTRAIPPKQCRKCEQSMRSRAYPEGVVIHEGYGYCRRCYPQVYVKGGVS